MTTHPHSPNWYWQQLDYTIEREVGAAGNVSRRTIRRPDGSAVQIKMMPGEQGYDAELRAAHAEYYGSSLA